MSGHVVYESVTHRDATEVFPVRITAIIVALCLVGLS